MAGDDDRDEGMDDGFDFVILSDDEGNEVKYAILRILEVEGNEYALLTPVEAETSEDQLTILILRYEVDEAGDEVFSHLDDETFAKVQAHAEALFDAEGDEDDDDDDADLDEA